MHGAKGVCHTQTVLGGFSLLRIESFGAIRDDVRVEAFVDDGVHRHTQKLL